jgi:hypothetical protein
VLPHPRYGSQCLLFLFLFLFLFFQGSGFRV